MMMSRRPRVDFKFSEDEDVQKIDDLKNIDFQTNLPGTFEVSFKLTRNNGYYPTSSFEEVMIALLEIFLHFVSNGINWEKLVMNCADDPNVRVLIGCVNLSHLFSEMVLVFNDFPEDESDRAGYDVLGFTRNKRLEVLRLVFDNCPINVTDTLSLKGLLKSTTTSLKELEVKGTSYFLHQEICEGLAANKTLKRLYFNFTNCELFTDETISDIIESVTTHTSLQEIVLVDGQFSQLTSSSLERLVTQSSTLTTLTIGQHGNKTLLKNQFIPILARNLMGTKNNKKERNVVEICDLYHTGKGNKLTWPSKSRQLDPGCWPYVISSVNHNTSIIYDLVRGPAFAARQAL